ncbi:MAG: DUF4469 domain-containing protein [Treponema sp.]|nr:DUF4469 domain-containing protein [Treponema sp.]
MIAITPHKNQLKTSRKNYCFRSVTDQTLKSEQLIREIVDYNSTITEADARAVLAVLDDRVRYFVRMGYKVELPFAYIRLKASGTAGKLTDSFMPGTGDHKLKAVCSIKKEAASEMEHSTAWRITGRGWVILPKITELSGINSAGKEVKKLAFAPGDLMRIRGRNLHFDAADEKQGVFFVDEQGCRTRADRYSNIGTAITDAFIPDSLVPGTYTVKIVTEPRRDSYEQYIASTPITVTAVDGNRSQRVFRGALL